MAAETASLGAQRLVASTEKPLVGVIRIGSKALPVLNALRHQRKNHQGCTCRIDRHSTRVLNALRHQRKNHIDNANQLGFVDVDVLNALRHQRKNHRG